MTALEIQDLARNWIRYQEAWERVGGPCRECTELQWAYNLVDDMVIDRPEESWQLILTVRRLNRTTVIEQMLAAAVFEDLMSVYGATLIDRVEAEVKRDPTFVGVIRSSYKAHMSEEVWSRLKAIADPAVFLQLIA
ncbi:DUF6869 domain-containing protein [Granulicella sp. L46]|jgi:hypothetical protein|uniref:DUF6869 domain-containing protein n=1 Tax=Granulicella sp. L46 TaxID=1641865 RepID=UPI00131CC95E|nr:hypothetical protein [Granulicella sp. L46]